MFDRIIGRLAEFTAGQDQDDDITLAVLDCVPNAGPKVRARDTIKVLPWSLNYDLGIDDIRASNPVSQIVPLLSNAIGLDVHQDYLSTILSELYSNALEHGLLELDSSMKQTEDGFMDYYSLRSQRLADLQTGMINIQIHFKHNGSCYQIELQMSDSGAGFDYQKARAVAGENDAFGRGIGILESLCDDVVYSKGGSSVTVTYALE
nr:ATP-binding protein [Oceanicoccus sagamiensis]